MPLSESKFGSSLPGGRDECGSKGSKLTPKTWNLTGSNSVPRFGSELPNGGEPFGFATSSHAKSRALLCKMSMPRFRSRLPRGGAIETSVPKFASRLPSATPR